MRFVVDLRGVSGCGFCEVCDWLHWSFSALEIRFLDFLYVGILSSLRGGYTERAV